MDEQIQKAKQDLLDAERKQKEPSDINAKASADLTLANKNELDATIAVTNALLQFGVLNPPNGGNYGLHGALSDPGENAQGCKTYETYPGEGHAANFRFGGKHITNETGYHLGTSVARQYGLHPGDKFHTQMGWGTYEDTSERAHGIETSWQYSEQARD